MFIELRKKEIGLTSHILLFGPRIFQLTAYNLNRYKVLVIQNIRKNANN